MHPFSVTISYFLTIIAPVVLVIQLISYQKCAVPTKSCDSDHSEFEMNLEVRTAATGGEHVGYEKSASSGSWPDSASFSASYNFACLRYLESLYMLNTSRIVFMQGLLDAINKEQGLRDVFKLLCLLIQTIIGLGKKNKTHIYYVVTYRLIERTVK
jgi:hypothetical protein